MNVAWNVNAITAVIMMAAANRPKNDCDAKRNSRLPKFHRSSPVKLHQVGGPSRYRPDLRKGGGKYARQYA